MSATPAHTEHLRAELVLYFPAHDPRETDPHYHVFDATRRKLKAGGLWRCHVPGCNNTDIEVHHDLIEFSLINGVDLDKFNELYGLHLDDEAFKDYVEGAEGTTPLCRLHHRGTVGIHNLRTPEWRALLVWRADLPAPGQVVRGEK